MGDLRIRASVVLAGLRWRVGASLAMFLVAVIGIGIGAFGPLYLHGADQTALEGTVRSSLSTTTGITLQSATGTGTVAQLAKALAMVPSPGGGGRWFGQPIDTEDVGVSTATVTHQYGAEIVARTGVCAHVVVVAGHCVDAPATVMLSTRTARTLGARVGDDVTFSYNLTKRSQALEVVGLFLAGNPADSYWWGNNYFPFGSGKPSFPSLDDVFATPATLFAAPSISLSPLQVQVPFIASSLNVDNVGQLVSSLASWKADALRSLNVNVGTGLDQLLGQVTSTESTMAPVIAVIDLQLVLLAVCILYYVASRTAVEREADLRLALLRGLPQRIVVGVALSEPLVVVVAAVPVGLALAWLATAILGRHLFGAGVGTAVTPLAVVAAVGAGVAGMVATSLGARQAIRAGDPAEPQGRPTGHIWRVVGDVAAVSVAVAAVVALLTTGVGNGAGAGTTNPLSAFAPGLLAVGVGVLGARLLRLATGATLGLSATTRRVSWALAARRVARRSDAAPQVVLLTIAVALAAFGVSGWAVAARNRTTQSAFLVGAARVAVVSVPQGMNFLAAVRVADGGRDEAMAVAVERASDGITVAVDSRRLPEVMSWPSGLSTLTAPAVARAIAPRGLASPIVVKGHRLALTLDTESRSRPDPAVSVDLFDPGYLTVQSVPLGPLHHGLWTYTSGPIGDLCPLGCQLDDIAVSWSAPAFAQVQQTAVQLELSAVRVQSPTGAWATLPAGIGSSRAWRGIIGTTAISVRAGITVAHLSVSSGAPTSFGPADTPSQLPAVVTPSYTSNDLGAANAISVVGLDGTTLDGRAVTSVAAIPGIGANAALVDYQIAQRLLTGPFQSVTTEVWLRQGASPAILASLERQGIQVLSVQDAGRVANGFLHDGVGLAYYLFLVAVAAAALLAVGASAFALSVSAKRRGPELAAMRAMGLARGTLRRSIVLEQGLILVAGVLFGLVSGVMAAAVALRSVPEFVSLPPGPPLDTSLPAGLVAVTAAALVVVVAMTAVFGSRMVVRSATVERLGAPG